MKVLERRDHIERIGAKAVFVAHDPPAVLRRGVLAGLEVPFPVLLDLQRAAYRDWGLGRAPFWKIYFDPKVWWQYASSLLAGERLRPPGRDTLQLGGDFVVAPDGRIAYSRPQRRDDRPSVLGLIRVLESSAG